VRNGPLVHRKAHVSRLAYGSPSPLQRLALLAAGGAPRAYWRRISAEPGAPVPQQRIQLGSRLPINLRNFLAQQLGPAMRVEDDAIVALAPRSGDALMPERAREAWAECAIRLDRLECEFFGGSSAECGPVVLCLRCGCIGTGPMDQHCGSDCMAVDLSTEVHAERLAGTSPDGKPTPDALRHAVANFRQMRSAAGQPHHDLDCYVAGGQVIFTWRPLPAVRTR
jgi:hypothetical protein